jgi:hypothetical protein
MINYRLFLLTLTLTTVARQIPFLQTSNQKLLKRESLAQDDSSNDAFDQIQIIPMNPLPIIIVPTTISLSIATEIPAAAAQIILANDSSSWLTTALGGITQYNASSFKQTPSPTSNGIITDASYRVVATLTSTKTLKTASPALVSTTTGCICTGIERRGFTFWTTNKAGATITTVPDVMDSGTAAKLGRSTVFVAISVGLAGWISFS